MSIRVDLANRRARQQAPTARLTPVGAGRAPLWPTVLMVFLLCLPSIFASLILTIFNGLLVTLVAAIVLFANKRLDHRLFLIVGIFVLIAFVGMIMGEPEVFRRDKLKGVWYVLNPLLLICTGYALYILKPDLRRGLRAFVIGGFIVALWQLRGYMMDPSILKLPAATIRSVIGTGSYVPVLAFLILVIFGRRPAQDLLIPRWIWWIALIVIALSIAGTFSRTSFMVAILTFAAAIGCFTRREWLRLGVPAFLVLAASASLQMFYDTESEQALRTFAGKLARSIVELTVSKDMSYRDINLNYRGYETSRAWQQYVDSSVPEILLGRGFDATVDLGLMMPLEVSPTGFLGARHIWWIHNGYMWLLTKAGLAGLLLFLGFLFYLYRVGRSLARESASLERAALGQAMQAVTVTMVATTYIIGGVFNQGDMLSFLMFTGYALSYVGSKEVAQPSSQSQTPPDYNGRRLAF